MLPMLLLFCPWLVPAAHGLIADAIESVEIESDVRSMTLTVPFGIDLPDNNLGYAHAAAGLLALDEFQRRSSTIVPELGSLSEGCEIDWTVSMIDSEGSSVEIVRRIGESGMPDALIGGFHSKKGSDALDLSMLAKSLQVPTVLYGGSNLEVVYQSDYPYTTRTFPDVLAFGTALIDYLSDILLRDNYYGIITPAMSSIAMQNMQVLVDAADTKGIQTYVVSYQSNDYLPGRPIDFALEELRRTGFKTILVVLDTDDDYRVELETIAVAVADAGMSSTEYVWVLVGNLNLYYFDPSTLSPDVLDFVKGAVYIEPLERYGWFEVDPFLLEWQALGGDFVGRLNAMLPQSVAFRGQEDYFATHAPAVGAGYMFDAVLSLLLGTCQAEAQGGKVANPLLRQIAAIQSIAFNGPSGLVKFDAFREYPGARASYTVPFGAYNILPPGLEGNPLVAVRGGLETPTVTQTAWMSKMPHIYASGSADGPLLRNRPDWNNLEPFIRTWGYVLFGLVEFFVVACALWVLCHRASHLVRASQPIFLYGLLLGSTLVALCIIITSFDEDMGWTKDQLSKACTATPWLLISGIQLIYGSLFCKLYRVNKVLQFRRRKVSIASVIWPAAALFVVVLALLAAWTAAEGFDWVRTIHDPITGESGAKCTGNNTVAWFTPIFVLMLLPIIMTAVAVWKTRDIDESYTATKGLSAMILFQCQIILVAIPLFFLVENKDRNTRYLVHAVVFFLFAASSVGFVLVPKIHQFYFPASENKRGSIGAGGRGSVRVSGLQKPLTSSTRNFVTSGFSETTSARDNVASLHDSQPESRLEMSLSSVHEGPETTGQAAVGDNTEPTCRESPGVSDTEQGVLKPANEDEDESASQSLSEI